MKTVTRMLATILTGATAVVFAVVGQAAVPATASAAPPEPTSVAVPVGAHTRADPSSTSFPGRGIAFYSVHGNW